ncbi:hypothetical protein ACOMHN_039157 [Nucella lapillus]
MNLVPLWIDWVRNPVPLGSPPFLPSSSRSGAAIFSADLGETDMTRDDAHTQAFTQLSDLGSPCGHVSHYKKGDTANGALGEPPAPGGCAPFHPPKGSSGLATP